MTQILYLLGYFGLALLIGWVVSTLLRTSPSPAARNRRTVLLPDLAREAVRRGDADSIETAKAWLLEGGAPAVRMLVGLLGSEDAVLSRKAVAALSDVGPEALDVLSDALEDAQGDLRLDIEEAIRIIESDEHVPIAEVFR